MGASLGAAAQTLERNGEVVMSVIHARIKAKRLAIGVDGHVELTELFVDESKVVVAFAARLDAGGGIGVLDTSGRRTAPPARWTA